MLKHRSTEKEQMDKLDLAGEQLHETLDGLSTINKYLGNTNATFQALKKEIVRSNEALTIVDLGCGGGDNLRAISAWCNQNGYSNRLIGIDGNANILDYAKAKNSTPNEIEYLQADILAEDFNLPNCDILISSHFMYHFSDSNLIDFLGKVKSKVRYQIVFSELQRNAIAYSLFKLGGAILPFSKMVRQDGLQAIKRSFRRKELEYIFQQADLKKYKISWKWAFRYMVIIDLS